MLDVGLVEVDDLRDWTSQVYVLGPMVAARVGTNPRGADLPSSHAISLAWRKSVTPARAFLLAAG